MPSRIIVDGDSPTDAAGIVVAISALRLARRARLSAQYCRAGARYVICTGRASASGQSADLLSRYDFEPNRNGRYRMNEHRYFISICRKALLLVSAGIALFSRRRH